MRLLHLISYCLWKILVHPFVMVCRLRMLHLLPIFGNCHDTLGQAISLCTESSPDDARAAMSAFRWPSQVVAMAQPRKTNMTQVCRSGLVHNHSVLDAIFKFHLLLFRTWLVFIWPAFGESEDPTSYNNLEDLKWRGQEPPKPPKSVDISWEFISET